MAENTGDFLGSIRALIKSELVDLNTSIAAVVVAYGDGFASVRPTGLKRFQDGDTLEFPVIHQVPVRWPVFNGGQCGFRAPIKAGDKCHLVFSQQANDGSDDQRRHDLTDAYALMMDNSRVSQGGNESELVMYFGSAYIKITAGGAIEIVAPGGLTFTTPSVTHDDKEVGSTHTHSGVVVGGANSGPVT